MKKSNTSPLRIGLFYFIGILSSFYCLNAQNPASISLVKAKPPCTVSPIISCPPNVTVLPGVSSDPNAHGCATALPGSRDCNQPIVEYVDRLTQGSCPGSGTIQRLWTATDPEDPLVRSFCIQYITKEDKTAPRFLNCPKDTSILSNSKCVASFTWISPWVTDESGKFSLQSSHINGDMFPIGVTTITFTATDECGNVSTTNIDLSC